VSKSSTSFSRQSSPPPSSPGSDDEVNSLFDEGETQPEKSKSSVPSIQPVKRSNTGRDPSHGIKILDDNSVGPVNVAQSSKQRVLSKLMFTKKPSMFKAQGRNDSSSTVASPVNIASREPEPQSLGNQEDITMVLTNSPPPMDNNNISAPSLQPSPVQAVPAVAA
jgi:hypothetical protein